MIFAAICLMAVKKKLQKELSLGHKLKYSNPYIFKTRCYKPLIFQTQVIWLNRFHSLKYLRSTTFGSKDKVIRNSEFVAKTQFLYLERRKLRMVSNLWKKFPHSLEIEFILSIRNILYSKLLFGLYYLRVRLGLNSFWAEHCG